MDEIRLGKDVSRNASEFGSASLHILIATNLPDVVKSSIGGEATGIRSRRAIRGERKQRASKVELGTWEIPSGGLVGGDKTTSSNRTRE